MPAFFVFVADFISKNKIIIIVAIAAIILYVGTKEYQQQAELNRLNRQLLDESPEAEKIPNEAKKEISFLSRRLNDVLDSFWRNNDLFYEIYPEMLGLSDNEFIVLNQTHIKNYKKSIRNAIDGTWWSWDVPIEQKLESWTSGEPDLHQQIQTRLDKLKLS